ncbi:hypothetical protein SRIMM317S_02214 [Streptomyces rimosus subsp. rimosus]
MARLSHLSTFDLRDVYGDLPCDAKREQVLRRYAPSLDALRAETRDTAAHDGETLRLYRGITRFLFEDTTGFEGTRSALAMRLPQWRLRSHPAQPRRAR